MDIRHWIILCGFFGVFVGAYNLDLTSKNAKYLISPVVQKLGTKPLRVPSLPPSVKPSYFGYHFSTSVQDNGDIRLLVGTPKAVDPSNPDLQAFGSSNDDAPRGGIQSCPIKRNFFFNVKPTCEPVSPPDAQPGDYFGTHIGDRADGNILSCSPTRSQNCSSIVYVPGYCYMSKNLGKDWSEAKNASPKKCPVLSVEVLFVLDGSGSVENAFETVREWVKKVTKKLRIDRGKVLVGVVQYSHWYRGKHIQKQEYIKTEIPIGKYKSFSSFARAVDRIRLQAFTTYTGHALEKVAYDFKQSRRFRDVTTKQVMILLTDGQSDDFEVIPDNAKALRNMGVTTFAVGVAQAKQKELGYIANGNRTSTERVFKVNDFSKLDSIVNQLQTQILNFVPEGVSDVNKVTYEMQLGELGFSSSYSKPKPGHRSVRSHVSSIF